MSVINNDEDLNNFLLQIEQLEQRNEELSIKIEEIKNQIKKIKVEPSKNKIVKTEKIDNITLEEDRKAAKRFENELKFLNINSLQITENLIEKKISFKPNKQYGAIYILGDFNGWEPESMQKNEEEYWYKVVLIKGFKFYYSLQTTEDIILDYNSPYEENQMNSQLQNYINLYQDDNYKTSNFDYKNDLNILKAAQRNFILLKINDNQDNSIFLEKFQRHALNAIKKSGNDKYEKIKKEISTFYNDYLNKINSIDKNKLQKLKSYFNDRILVQNSPKIKDVQYQYKIISISDDNNSFICLRLYDHNQIKLNEEYYYTNKNYCWKIPFSEITSKPITKRDKLYHLFSLKESQKFVNEYNKDEENIIIAYFNDLEELNKNSRFKRYRKTNNVADLVTPKKIEPNDVDMNDYEYYYLNNEIIYVRNKEDNSYVFFKIIEENKKIKKYDEPIKNDKTKDNIKIKEEIVNKNDKIPKQNETEQNKTKKEIINKKEKKPIQFLVYYTFSDTNKIIILHCHILDKLYRYKKMKIKEIGDNDDPHILKRDKIYINSNELLLIKCQEKIYNGKEILNGIDAKVEYNDSFGDDTHLAVTPCLLVELSKEEEDSLKNQPKKEVKKEKKSYELDRKSVV